MKHEAGFTDSLNFAHFVDDGIIVNKDGALLCAFEGRGPDLQSASGVELDALSHTMNQMALVVENGWMMHIDELRFPSTTYPEEGAFPESVSRLIDEERRQQYEAEGTHFENKIIFTFVWKFPKPKVNVMRHWLVEGADVEEDARSLEALIAEFKDKVNRCEGLLAMHLWLKALNSAELLSHLNTCISGEFLPVAVPPEGCFLDMELGRHNVVGGYRPRVGKNHVMMLSLASYLNPQTRPALLEAMGTYPLVYRWSNRFVFLSESTADKEISRYKQDWNNKVKGISGAIKEGVFKMPATKIDEHAADMKVEANEAASLNSSRTIRFGYFTSNIVLMHEQVNVLEEAATSLRRYMEQSGFGVVEEDVNAMDTWMGSIPGHGSRNIRRMFFNSVNWAHCLPLHTTWSGAQQAHPSSLLGAGSPPAFYAATTGQTPFRFWPDVQDVGHMMVLGPTGSGKSTFLQLYIAQFLRYPGARVFILDKDYTHRGLTHALNGDYFNIHPDVPMAFCPLADLSTPSRCLRAEEWIVQLILLQGVEVTPKGRIQISETIQAMRKESLLTSNTESAHRRNLTVFCSSLQDLTLREALRFYTLDGSMPLMDATHDTLSEHKSHLTATELGWILKQKPHTFVPMVSYLTDYIDACAEEAGHHPLLIVIEEAWLSLKNALLAEKIIDWCKVLRKKNGRVVFATQSLADLYNPANGNLTETTASIVDACQTKVYLPNTSMEEASRNLYKKMGLTDRECDMLSREAIPKRHYFVKTPEGQRLIELGFNDREAMALSFIGLSDEKSEALVACKKKYGHQWVYHWLCQQGFSEWGDYWLKHEEKNHVAA